MGLDTDYSYVLPVAHTSHPAMFSEATPYHLASILGQVKQTYNFFQIY